MWGGGGHVPPYIVNAPPILSMGGGGQSPPLPPPLEPPLAMGVAKIIIKFAQLSVAVIIVFRFLLPISPKKIPLYTYTGPEKWWSTSCKLSLVNTIVYNI